MGQLGVTEAQAWWPPAPLRVAQPCSRFRAQAGAVELVSDLGVGEGTKAGRHTGTAGCSERCRPSSVQVCLPGEEGVRGTVR